MRIIALDPGYDRLGVAVLEKTENGERLLFSTCITTPKSESLPVRLHILGNALATLLAEYIPTALAIETLFFNKNSTTAIGVAEARGICIFLAVQHNCTIYEFNPQEVKVATTGYGKSDKAAVISMVRRLIPNAPVGAPDDEYDAIAIGITALAIHGSK
jgi:crossover junction endodeoxyribonuclease RuvC